MGKCIPRFGNAARVNPSILPLRLHPMEGESRLDRRVSIGASTIGASRSARRPSKPDLSSAFEASAIVGRDKHPSTREPRVPAPPRLNVATNLTLPRHSAVQSFLLSVLSFLSFLPFLSFFFQGIIHVPLAWCVCLGPFGGSSQGGRLCRERFRAGPEQ
jgi:hypothetical protein